MDTFLLDSLNYCLADRTRCVSVVFQFAVISRMLLREHEDTRKDQPTPKLCSFCSPSPQALLNVYPYERGIIYDLTRGAPVIKVLRVLFISKESRASVGLRSNLPSSGESRPSRDENDTIPKASIAYPIPLTLVCAHWLLLPFTANDNRVVAVTEITHELEFGFPRAPRDAVSLLW